MRSTLFSYEKKNPVIKDYAIEIIKKNHSKIYELMNGYYFVQLSIYVPEEEHFLGYDFTQFGFEAEQINFFISPKASSSESEIDFFANDLYDFFAEDEYKVHSYLAFIRAFTETTKILNIDRSDAKCIFNNIMKNATVVMSIHNDKNPTLRI